MGSFSVACTASGISITSGQKAVFIPLLPTGEFGDSKGMIKMPPMHMLVTNSGVMSLYQPFSLPIFGTYNDYGSLEDIERTPTVVSIERYFNISIDEFMEVATRNWCEDNSEDMTGIKNRSVIKKLSGCFINRDLYDSMSKIEGHADRNYQDFLKGASIGKITLTALGFKQVEDNDNKRYTQTWIMEGETEVKVCSDGNWSSHIIIDGKSIDGLYHLDKFIKEWNKHSKVKIDISKFEGLSKYHFVYDDMKNTLERTLSNDIEITELSELSGDPGFTSEQQERLDDLKWERKRESFNMHRLDHRLPLSNWDTSFSKLYDGMIRTDQGGLKKEFIDYFAFYHKMWANNRILTPMYSGPQCGDVTSQLIHAKKIVEILEGQVDPERESDDEDH